MISSQQRLRITCSTQRAHGFTLIEMMVAMLLGLIVIAGVISVFLAGQQTYRTNEALGDVENGSRTAFELLARDLRDAGLTGCDNSNGRLANVVQGGGWYANWNNAVHGYDDASTDPALTGITSGGGVPVAGQSSVQIISTANTDITVSWTPSSNSADFKINAATTQINKGDLIMVCDFDHATILQISNYSGSNVDVEHNSGNAVSPGNCSKGLGYPTDCSSANGNAYAFPGNSRVAKLTAVDWYIGKNLAGTTSLYRLPAVNNSGTVGAVTPQEMVRNVTSMKIKYLQPPGTSFLLAANVTNWAVVNAAQVTLSLQSTNQRASVTNSTALTRTFTSTTTVRNRVQ